MEKSKIFFKEWQAYKIPTLPSEKIWQKLVEVIKLNACCYMYEVP